MGGEKFPSAHCPLWRLGSPPHGRGKAEIDRLHKAVNKDHPRMGGEKLGFFLVCQPLIGSPPHGRGKVKLRFLPSGYCGITPAWAGKSPRRWGRCRAHRDHPRMGGEKGWIQNDAAAAKGSPPHGRGKVQLDGLRSKRAGITPAWAGKRTSGGSNGSVDKDHPRMGGEKCARVA